MPDTHEKATSMQWLISCC